MPVVKNGEVERILLILNVSRFTPTQEKAKSVFKELLIRYNAAAIPQENDEKRRILKELKDCIDFLAKTNRKKENLDTWREKVAVEFTSAGPVPDAHVAAGDGGVVAAVPPPTKKGRPSKRLR